MTRGEPVHDCFATPALPASRAGSELVTPLVIYHGQWGWRSAHAQDTVLRPVIRNWDVTCVAFWR